MPRQSPHSKNQELSFARIEIISILHNCEEVVHFAGHAYFCNRFRASTTAPSGPALSPSVPETIFTRSAS